MAKNKNLRLIIDTNLWISFIISNNLNQLQPILLTDNCKILFSIELIKEIETTIKKPKLKKYFTENAIEEMLMVLEPYIQLVKVSSTIKVCRDEKDDFLLSLAKDGKANYILTGDKDLLSIGKFDKTKILTISEFFDTFE